ncbi:cation diffusion facilitator family transporter [Aneurinibacillus terranovensis]|uniref:cation diffusion facilitator family transporter n=1 Tax=Aneurinibacillus terranovensis TaxID=278991 RepID=UPI001FDEDCA6|nr:cation diffusion facilitator family transporter [Aneurinibacillus terranovensis]
MDNHDPKNYDDTGEHSFTIRDHHHSHDSHDHHSHDDIFHSHAPVGKMKWAFFLTVIILLVELAGGFLSHSLALLSDAGHVFTDIIAIGLSWYALNLTLKPPSENMTYGYHRSGILAAFINAVTLIVIALLIGWEAYHRFQHPQPVESTWMFVSAGVGLVVNLYLGLGLTKEDNINVRSAVLHMLGDAAASAGVIIGGIIISLTGWYSVDPILSILIAVLIAFGAWKIVKQTLVVLMEGTPQGINIQKIADKIRSIKGVDNIHDLHIWSITSGKNALSCHIVLDGNMTLRESQLILRDIEHELIHLGISHVTIQPEDKSHSHKESLLCCDDGSDTHVHHHEH